MEDRYLFKAKHIHVLPNNNHLDGPWVVGFLSGERYIANDSGEYLIEPSTICQCTGLKDKNGKLIYEGDIVKCLYDSYGENGVYIGKVIYREDTCCFVDANSESTDYEWWEEEKEVIGNIFDNKELLESEEK